MFILGFFFVFSMFFFSSSLIFFHNDTIESVYSLVFVFVVLLSTVVVVDNSKPNYFWLPMFKIKRKQKNVRAFGLPVHFYGTRFGYGPGRW